MVLVPILATSESDSYVTNKSTSELAEHIRACLERQADAAQALVRSGVQIRYVRLNGDIYIEVTEPTHNESLTTYLVFGFNETVDGLILHRSIVGNMTDLIAFFDRSDGFMGDDYTLNVIKEVFLVTRSFFTLPRKLYNETRKREFVKKWMEIPVPAHPAMEWGYKKKQKIFVYYSRLGCWPSLSWSQKTRRVETLLPLISPANWESWRGISRNR